jgi:hypothetical protein
MNADVNLDKNLERAPFCPELDRLISEFLTSSIMLSQSASLPFYYVDARQSSITFPRIARTNSIAGLASGDSRINALRLLSSVPGTSRHINI